MPDNTLAAPTDPRTGALVQGGLWGYSGNVWVVTWGPYNQRRYISRVAIKVLPDAVSPSTDLGVWIEADNVTIAPSGIARSFAPVRLDDVIPAGSRVYLVWNYGGGSTAPQATLITRQDSIFGGY